MSDSLVSPFDAPSVEAGGVQSWISDIARPPPLVVQYGLSLLLVAVATGLGYVAEKAVTSDNVTLIYVLPVVMAASAFGWGPALAAVAASVLAFDFFFTEPRYSFTIYSPVDLWAAILLFVVAGVVSAVAAQARRKALEAQRAAGQARALQGLAHLVVEGRGESEILRGAAAALHAIFRAPAAIFVERNGEAVPLSMAGGAIVDDAEREAAKGALATHAHLRAETYPYESSRLELWPIASRLGRNYVLGVQFARGERPAGAEDFIEVVGAYLTAGAPAV
jgi:K+-sensing histidine kinase KdpD